jgi:hypothetical protein
MPISTEEVEFIFLVRHCELREAIHVWQLSELLRCARNDELKDRLLESKLGINYSPTLSTSRIFLEIRSADKISSK